MQLIIQPDGAIRCLYSEAIALPTLGRLTIRRASHVEPTADGQWLADLSPLQEGLVFGPFQHRSQALEAEEDWINANRLNGGRS